MATVIIIITALLLAAGLIAAIMAVKSAGEHMPNTYEWRTEEHKDEQKREKAQCEITK